MSKLDEERKLKKTVGEELNVLDEIGQDSEEKAAKIIIDLGKEEFEKSEKKDMLTVEKLDDARKKPFDEAYYRSILAECNLRMSEFSLPMGFRWIAKVSKAGLAMFIEAPDKQQYAKGVKITGVPFDDAKGVVGLVNKSLEQVDFLEQQWKILSSTKTKN